MSTRTYVLITPFCVVGSFWMACDLFGKGRFVPALLTLCCTVCFTFCGTALYVITSRKPYGRRGKP